MSETVAIGPHLDRGFVDDWGRRFAAAWNAHDPDAIAALCTEDVFWSDPAMQAPADGRKGVRAFAAFTFSFFPGFRVEEREQIYLSPIEPVALCPYRMNAGGDGETAGGQRLELDAIDQWTFRGELLCRCVTYYDHAEMMRRLAPARR